MKNVIHLNRKLVLEEAQRTADGAGGYQEEWVQIGTMWASIEATSGSEIGEDFLTISRAPAKIIVRSAPHASDRRPKPDQRFLEGGRIFKILSVNEADHHGHYLLCQTREEISA